MDPRVFFPLGPPPYAPRPSDHALEMRISKLAEFAARNGTLTINLNNNKKLKTATILVEDLIICKILTDHVPSFFYFL
jgi:hypothetical protein